MNLDRTKTALSGMSSPKKNTEEKVSLSKAELLQFVWELTQEVYSFTRGYNAQSRLQRDIISITRK